MEWPTRGRAIIGLYDQGKTTSEIAGLMGITENSVLGQLSAERAKHRRRGLGVDQREKALRIYRAALAVMAEGIGTTPDKLHIFLSGLKVQSVTASAPAPEQTVPDVEPAPTADLGDTSAEGPIISGASIEVEKINITPEPLPMLQMRPAAERVKDEAAAGGMVTLRNTRTGEWLHLSGHALTHERDYAYCGTVTQAKKMREHSAIAKGLSITHFNPK